MSKTIRFSAFERGGVEFLSQSLPSLSQVSVTMVLPNADQET